MGISLKALIENPKKIEDLKVGAPSCPYCKVNLRETITGKRPTPKGPACSDCHYEQLGELVEQYPIVTARVRRG